MRLSTTTSIHDYTNLFYRINRSIDRSSIAKNLRLTSGSRRIHSLNKSSLEIFLPPERQGPSLSPPASPSIERRNACLSTKDILTKGCRVQTTPPIPREAHKGQFRLEAEEGVPRPSRREGVQRVIGVGCKTTAAGEGEEG